MAKEDEVKLIAYQLWEEEKCPDGLDCEHWYRAELIWQQRQQPKTTASGTKTGPKQVPQQKPKAPPAKQKS